MMRVLPLMAVVFVAFLVTGIAMPVLPLHVSQGLGLGAFAVGLVAGSQFGAALLSRLWAGYYADSRGAKRAVVLGLVGAAASGLLYLLSLRFTHEPYISVSILLAGRALLGAAESFIITGSLTWALTLGGHENAGRVMAWIGIGMYAAFAIGAPVGTVLYERYGFIGVGLATMLIPLGTLLLVAYLERAAPLTNARPSFRQVVRVVWMPGLGLAFSSVGFGAIATFIVLLYAERQWPSAWLAFTGLSLAFVAGRMAFGHLPDRIGGAKVALAFVLVEAAGQALIWWAPGYAVVLTGALLTGFGYSLVFPGFGVEAIHRAPPQNRGLAMGAYTAFLDMALGVGSPVLGLIASGAGLRSVFAASTLSVLCAAGVATRLMWRNGN
jgi:MFS family permease